MKTNSRHQNKDIELTTVIHKYVEAARAGTNPKVICRVPSGWMVLFDLQFLRGYSLLLPDPVVTDLNLMNKEQRLEYLNDMSILGDALIEVTGAYRINYKILCNLEPALHAHVVPRYLTEPEELRKDDPNAYDKKYRESVKFDYERDKELMKEIARAVQKRL